MRFQFVLRKPLCSTAGGGGGGGGGLNTKASTCSSSVSQETTATVKLCYFGQSVAKEVAKHSCLTNCTTNGSSPSNSNTTPTDKQLRFYRLVVATYFGNSSLHRSLIGCGRGRVPHSIKTRPCFFFFI